MADTDFNDFSRYFQTRRVVTEDGERYIEWQPPKYGVLPERLYVVTDADVDRPDLIADRTLGDVRLWWEILHYNNIQDPMSLEAGDKLRIPRFDLPVVTSAAEVLVETVSEIPIRHRCIPLPPFQDPDDIEALPVTPSTSPVIILNFGFPVPPCLSGLAHFQFHASLLPDFSQIVLSKLTQADVTRWFYYDPAANSGAGGFISFPTTGIDSAILSGQTVYHSIIEGELDPDNIYYFRYRVWYDKPNVGWTETAWYAPPAIQLP